MSQQRVDDVSAPFPPGCPKATGRRRRARRALWGGTRTLDGALPHPVWVARSAGIVLVLVATLARRRHIMARRILAKCLVVAVCFLAVSLLLPAGSAEATDTWSTTDPWVILERELERELGPVVEPVFECFRDVWGCAAEVVASVWQYCDPDFSGAGEDDLDEVQELLDCLGLIPVAGIAFDTANVAISLTRGNWGDAALSAVFVVPIVGQLAAIKITVKSRVTKSITIEALEKAKKARPIHRASPLPSPSDTVSVKAGVKHNTAKGPRSRHLRSGLKREAGIPESEWDLWTVDHPIPRAMHSADEMRLLNNQRLRVLTQDANQVKSRIEDAVTEFVDRNKDDVVDFVVDHGTKARRPDRVQVKVYVNGGDPIVATIPNVHGANLVATLHVPKTISKHAEGWRLAGAIQGVVAGSSTESRSAPVTVTGGASTAAAQPQPVPTLTITTSDAGDRCAGCWWMVGHGSGWTAGERFHVRCSGAGEAFADTSTGKGSQNGFRARHASPSGKISWGTQICYSSFRETLVEVWNASGQRAAVTVR